MLSPSFLARMKRILGDRFEGYEESFSLPRKNALQLNRTKGDVSLPFPTEPISYYADGRYFSAEKPGSHPLHHAGAYYIQEPSAMAPVASLVGRLPTDARVLDVCASPGGKTSQLARLFCDSPMIVSNEIGRQHRAARIPKRPVLKFRCGILGKKLSRGFFGRFV